MSVAHTVGDALSLEGIRYRLLARDPSQAGGTAPAPWHTARAVLMKDHGGHLLAVLPASRRLDEASLRAQLHRPDLARADDWALDESFYDCRLGFVPPLGPWYRIPTVVDMRLRDAPQVYFEGGDGQHLVCVEEEEFERLLDGAEYLDISIAADRR